MNSQPVPHFELSDEEIMLRVGHLPALVIPKGRLARSVALRLQALFAHVGGNRLCLGVKLLNTGCQFLQMQMPLIVHHFRLLENAAHVALQLFVIVNLAVAELQDGLCVPNPDKQKQIHFQFPRTIPNTKLRAYHRIRAHPLLRPLFSRKCRGWASEI